MINSTMDLLLLMVDSITTISNVFGILLVRTLKNKIASGRFWKKICNRLYNIWKDRTARTSSRRNETYLVGRRSIEMGRRER